jgi:hypothetical protein
MTAVNVQLAIPAAGATQGSPWMLTDKALSTPYSRRTTAEGSEGDSPLHAAAIVVSNAHGSSNAARDRVNTKTPKVN